MTSSERIRGFRRLVWNYWEKNGRHDLPWRKTTDPYRILVSEMMLQQTQVSRVIEKYKSFVKRFPTVRALAKAPLSEVLKEWSGLGYNRRAKYLHNAAMKLAVHQCVNKAAVAELITPGVGEYTRNAVLVFAFNEPRTMLETNIRTAFIHHFPKRTSDGLFSDAELLAVAAKAAKGQDPRKWHWALMDYGAHLKKSGVRNNSRSAHYKKQSKFEGSLREVRGAILRSLHVGSKTSAPLMNDIRCRSLRRMEEALRGLTRDGLITKGKGKWRIA
jgi:A/G-specific adenine glycosylase